MNEKPEKKRKQEPVDGTGQRHSRATSPKPRR